MTDRSSPKVLKQSNREHQNIIRHHCYLLESLNWYVKTPLCPCLSIQMATLTGTAMHVLHWYSFIHRSMRSRMLPLCISTHVVKGRYYPAPSPFCNNTNIHQEHSLKGECVRCLRHSFVGVITSFME